MPTDTSAPAEVVRLQHVIDRDRYVAAACLGAIEKVLSSRAHLAEPGRGSYEWDDERYQQEFGLALDEIKEALWPLRRLAKDKTDCATDPDKVVAARAAGHERFNALNAQPLAADALDAGTASRLVPVVPTEEQWGGLARAIMMWLDMTPKTPRMLFKHLECSGHQIPQWLRDDTEMRALDHVPSKGTRCYIIYRAMVEAASTPKPTGDDR